MKEIKKSGALEGQVVVVEAVVSVDDKGKTHIHEPGHGLIGGGLGAVGGGLLGLIGGPAGLLAWTVGGAVVGGVAGKYLGRPFSKGDLKQIGEAMQPDTSAFMLLAMTEKKTYPEEYTEKVFKGKVELDVRDSQADWGPYSPPKAPEDAPNVLFILYDDTGLAAWSPYGGRINMPTLQKLADTGGIGSARQHPGVLRRRQRHLGRGFAERLGQ